MPILETYRQILKKTYSRPDTFISEGYEREIRFMDITLKFHWDISIMKKLSKTAYVQLVPVKEIYPLVDLENIQVAHLFQQNSEPVFLAEIPFCNPNICPIDGNHRIVSAYKRNVPFIPAQYFTCEEHVRALSNNSNKLFKICCNILTYSLIVEGKYSLPEIESELFIIH